MRDKPVTYHIAKYFLILILLVGLVGPLFTSNAPWKWTKDGITSYPAWSIYLDHLGIKEAPAKWVGIDWQATEGEITRNVVPYSSTYLDLEEIGAKKPNAKKRHYLGTDLLGRDVLAGLIQGSFVSLIIGFLATLTLFVISLCFSLSTSYVGNEQIKLNWLQLLAVALLALFLSYYLFIAFPASALIGVFFRIILLLLCLVFMFKKVSEHKSLRLKKFSIPFDDIGLKIYEIYNSIPRLILLLLLVGLSAKKGVINLALILGLVAWPVLYRYLRIEFLQEKAKNSFEAMKNMGFGDVRIIFVHLLPSILKTIITPLIFIFISAIITEATLSFLGLGLNDEIVSWGKILSQARQRIDAWWLVLFPGLMLFFTLYSLSIVSKYWNSN